MRNSAALKIAAVAVAAAAVLLFGITAVQVAKRRADAEAASRAAAQQMRTIGSENDKITFQGVTYERRKGPETYLVLGVDRFSKDVAKSYGGGQADLLLLLVTDYVTDTYRIVPISRDTLTMVTVIDQYGNRQIGGTVFDQICISHAYGTGGEDSCENTVRSVEYLLPGAKVDGYIALAMDSIDVLIDAVGGVTLTIDKDLTGANPAFTEGATVTLDAETAEQFVRARMSVDEDTNADRLRRQLTFMNAWAEKAKRLSSKQILNLLRQIEEICVTDMTEKRLSSIADEVRKYENGGVLTIDGEYVESQSYHDFHADEDSIMKIVLELYYTPVTHQDIGDTK